MVQIRRVQRRKKPRPYIDTNLFLDYVRNRNKESVMLLETIRHKKIVCRTSYYTLLELIDREQENRWIWKRVQTGDTLDDFLRHRYPRKLDNADLSTAFKEVETKFLKPFVDTDIVYLVYPSGQSWDSILKILRTDNFSVGDAFQVDASIGTHCNVFITRDSELAKMLNDAKLIPATTPEELDNILKENGIRSII
jgi:predicted nucleic acid-binding protein